jgi:hypothetical protein
MRFVRAACIVLAALSAAGTLTATALAAEEKSGGGFGPAPSPLERAKEESGLEGRPATRFAVPSGQLDVTPSELLAARAAQRLRFAVTLQRPTPDAALLVRLPARWLAVAPSGLPGARAPALRERAAGRAALRRRGTLVELAFDGGETGDRASFEVTDVGIPAGTYELPFYWRDASGRTTRAGAARVVFYAPSRDAPTTDLATPGIAANASNDSIEESESFIAVDPADKNRIAVGINWQSTSMPLWITTNGGLNWTQRVMPQAIDQPGTANTENGDVCCDPTLAADALGNIWFGGLTLPNGGSNPSRIVVNRIAAGGTTFQAQTVGLPVGASGTQDKPMMTIDNTPTSPTFGRLYVVWDEPASGGVRVVVSTCDTRPGGVANAANCDNADHWTAPARITSAGGSYIYADVAVGPTGKAYVTWWDYSSTNAIRGSTCDGASVNCATAANWSADQSVAQLDATGGTPVPFACPILAQPGGRAAPDPQVDVDHSGGTNNGRVYVTWGDLRAGSGTTRCAEQVNGNGTPPLATHLTWDSFAAIGSAAGGLPGGALASTTVGTRLLTDGEGGGQSNSDDWFPWLAVDQSTGQAWADFYSTRDSAARTTTNFYARSVTASGSTLTVGPLNKVSAGASNYSSAPCCTFGNDYGDYTGFDAAGGIAYPVWSDNSTGDGEAFTFVSAVASQPPAVVTGSATSGSTTATVNGTVNPNGQATTYHFDYGTTPSYGAKAPVPDGNAGSSSAVQSVSGSLSGLAPSTTYHYRLVAANGSGTSNGADQTFTTAATPQPPSAVTNAASGVGDTGATLNGTVNPKNQATTYHFEYGTSTFYGTSTGTQNLAASNSNVSVSANVSGLSAGTTHHFRVVATNASGTTMGGDQSFTTTVPPPPKPTVVTGAASAIDETTATLGGTVNPNGLAASYHFEYGTTALYGSSTPDQSAGSGSSAVPASANLSGLSPNTQYHYRLVATSTAGEGDGQDATFTTTGPAPPPPSEPNATTSAATDVTTDAAKLNGTINANGTSDTTYWFEYGPTIGLGSETGHLPATGGSVDQAVATTLSGLAPGTTYYFRVDAQNSAGTVNGQTLPVTTASNPPPPGGGGTGTPTTTAPASGGTTPPPTIRPAFSLGLTFPSQRLGTVLSRRAVRASAACAAVCRLGARLAAPAGTARTLGLTRGRGAVELGRATIARASARRTTLSVPLSRRALRALAGRSIIAIELRITGTPLDGRAAVTRAVRLTLRRRGTSPTVTALRASAAASPVWLGWDALGALR